MRHAPIDSALFTANREQLRRLLPRRSLVVVNANDVLPTNADGSLAMHPNADLFYLTGVEQEESILVLSPDAADEKLREVLFLRETNEHLAIWALSCCFSSAVSDLNTVASAASMSTGGSPAALLLLRLWNVPDDLLPPCFALLLLWMLGARELSWLRCRPLRLGLGLCCRLSCRATSNVRADIACVAGAVCYMVVYPDMCCCPVCERSQPHGICFVLKMRPRWWGGDSAGSKAGHALSQLAQWITALCARTRRCHLASICEYLLMARCRAPECANLGQGHVLARPRVQLSRVATHRTRR